MTSPTSLFVYGTLLPGAQSWAVLEPFVVGAGIADSVRGDLFDTGLGYPAAVLDDHGANVVYGRVFQLTVPRRKEALLALDEFEDVADGLYQRVTITTVGGAQVWAYTAGTGLKLTPIVSGDWLELVSRRRDDPR